MAQTPNLSITEVNATDNNKATEIDTAISAFDVAYAGSLSLSIAGLTTYTVSQSHYQGASVLIFTGALSGNCTITLPSFGRALIIINETTGGYNLIFTNGSGATTATITDTNPHLIYCDGGNNVYKVS